MFSKIAFDALCHYDENHMILSSIGPIFEGGIDVNWDKSFESQNSKLKQVQVIR